MGSSDPLNQPNVEVNAIVDGELMQSEAELQAVDVDLAMMDLAIGLRSLHVLLQNVFFRLAMQRYTALSFLHNLVSIQLSPVPHIIEQVDKLLREPVIWRKSGAWD